MKDNGDNPIIASHYKKQKTTKLARQNSNIPEVLENTGNRFTKPARTKRHHVQLFSGPGPITQAVVVLNQYNLYFWNLHCCMDKWCEEKNFQILMSLEKSMPNSRKNMYLLSYLLFICLHERRKTFSRKGLNLGRFYLNKTPSQVH